MMKSLIVYDDEVIVPMKDLLVLLERVSTIYPLITDEHKMVVKNLQDAVDAFETAWDEA